MAKLDITPHAREAEQLLGRLIAHYENPETDAESLFEYFSQRAYRYRMLRNHLAECLYSKADPK